MLVNLTFEDPMLWVERHAPNRGPEWREWASMVRPKYVPKRWEGDEEEPESPPGIYMTSASMFDAYLGEGCSHKIISDSPFWDELMALEDVEARCRLMGQRIRAGTDRSDYGTADDLPQILDYYTHQIEDPNRQFVITVAWVDKVEDAGFRFHKNGPYIGTKHNIDEDGDPYLPEYIGHCENLNGVVLFHLIEVAPNTPGEST